MATPKSGLLNFETLYEVTWLIMRPFLEGPNWLSYVADYSLHPDRCSGVVPGTHLGC